MMRYLFVFVSLFSMQTALLPGEARIPEGEAITIEQAVTEAFENNAGLAVRKAGLPVFDARVLGARRRENPTLGLIVDHLDLLGTHFSEENGGGPAEITVNTEFTWERGRKRFHRTRVASLERETAGHQVDDEGRTLCLEVRNAFIDLLLAQKNSTLADENLEGMRKLAEINAFRVEKGDLAEVDLVRTQVAVAQLEEQSAEAFAEVRQAQLCLNHLLGRSEGSPLPLASGDFRRGENIPEISVLLKDALGIRPDLLALRSDRHRLEADLELQKAMAKGDITLGAEYRRQQGVNGHSNSLGFSVSIPLPVFNRNEGEIARAAAEARQAELSAKALEQSIRKEIADVVEQFRSASDQIRRLESQGLSKVRQVREIALYSYQRGEATLVEVLDAQRAFNDITQSYLNALAQRARSHYRLDAVTGKECRHE